MGAPIKQENARGLAIASFVLVGLWALTNVAVGLGLLATAHNQYRAIAPFAPPDPGASFDSWENQLGLLLMLAWFAAMNGINVAAVMGSIAIRRARAGWGRVLLYLVVVIGGVVLGAWWGLHDFMNADVPPDNSAKVLSGLGLILIAAASSAAVGWVLKPAFARPLSVLPPPDPSTLLYSDSTT